MLCAQVALSQVRIFQNKPFVKFTFDVEVLRIKGGFNPKSGRGFMAGLCNCDRHRAAGTRQRMFGIFLTSIRGSLGKIDKICSRILLAYSIAIKEPFIMIG